MEPIQISIIMPTFNCAQYIEQALDSILAQTVPPIEVLVGDDGSTDNTEEVLQRYKEDIQLFRYEHSGVYTIRNRLLDNIQGDWFLNVDADDWVDPTFLEEATALISAASDERLAFVYPDVERFGDGRGVLRKAEFDAELLKKGNYVVMSSLIRTDVARTVRFDPQFNEGWGDYDFFISLVKRGYVGRRLPNARLHYRIRDTSITFGNWDFTRNSRLMEKITAKHADFFTPEEAVAAKAKFTVETAIRQRVSELIQARRYAGAFRLFVKALITRPRTIFSWEAIHQTWCYIFSR